MAQSESKKRLVLVRNVGLGILLLGALPFAWSYMRDFVRRDPFADMKDSVGPNESNVAMELENVDIRHYRGQELVTKANAKKIEVDNHRQMFQLYDVSNGMIKTDEGGKVTFDAAEAVWRHPLKTLYVSKGAHVKDKNMDVKTPEVTFNQMKGTLSAEKEIKGKLGEGQVQAVRFNYNTNTGAFTVGKTKWAGDLNVGIQGDQATRWEIEGDDMARDPKAQTDTFLNATATDNEIILKAPKVVRDIKTDVVTGTGGVLYYSPEANMYADKVVVYRKEKRAVLTGNVRMLVKPEDQQDQPAKVEPIPEFQSLKVDQVDVKPPGTTLTDEDKKKLEDLRSSENMRRFPTRVRAQEIEYWYGEGNRKANIKGNPQARQDFADGLWRHIWSDHAFYDGEEETLTLYSSDKEKARMKNSIGDDYQANSFKTSTKKDDETFSGKLMKAIMYQLGQDETGRGNSGGSSGGGR